MEVGPQSPVGYHDVVVPPCLSPCASQVHWEEDIKIIPEINTELVKTEVERQRCCQLPLALRSNPANQAEAAQEVARD